MRKTIAKIYLKNIRENAQAFALLTGKKICAVVKANAYGHGAEEVVCALSGVADCFAVSLYSEAVAIKTAACGKDVLILTPPLSQEEAYLSAKNGFVLTVPDLWTARLIMGVATEYKLPVRVHIKTNTGMNRYGMNVSMLGKVCKLFRSCPLVQVEGLFSHLYTNTKQGAETQRKLFLQMQTVCKRYFPNVLCHLSATYGALLGKDYVFDMTRIGIGLYGYLPDGARDLEESTLFALRVKKGMRVYAYAQNNRTYRFGGAGYGKAQHSLELGEKLSVIRFGYADGFLRRKDNGVFAFENNVNNLCMDACLRKGGAMRGKLVPVMTDAAETAKATGTISYEVLCAASRRAEMVYEYE